MIANDNREMHEIVTKRGSYVLPVSAGRPWADVFPNVPPPRSGLKVWDTPGGRVITRPEA